MKKCPKCNTQLWDDIKYCVVCGENIENIKNQNQSSKKYNLKKLGVCVLCMAFFAGGVFIG